MPTPSDMPSRSSSQAGLTAFVPNPFVGRNPTPTTLTGLHDHTWLPVLTIRESTAHNAYVERRTYKCCCGEVVEA